MERHDNTGFFTLAGPTVSAETATENAGQERGKLFPTDIGLVVNDFLLEHFDTSLTTTSPQMWRESLM